MYLLLDDTGSTLDILNFLRLRLVDSGSLQ